MVIYNTPPPPQVNFLFKFINILSICLFAYFLTFFPSMTFNSHNMVQPVGIKLRTSQFSQHGAASGDRTQDLSILTTWCSQWGSNSGPLNSHMCSQWGSNSGHLNCSQWESNSGPLNSHNMVQSVGIKLRTSQFSQHGAVSGDQTQDLSIITCAVSGNQTQDLSILTTWCSQWESNSGPLNSHNMVQSVGIDQHLSIITCAVGISLNSHNMVVSGDQTQDTQFSQHGAASGNRTQDLSILTTWCSQWG